MGNKVIYSLNKAIKRMKYEKLFKKYKEFTMIPKEIFLGKLECINWYNVPKGNVVECGVWKGGMIASIAEMLGNDYSYYLFDSFEGLPEPNQIDDGLIAKNWYGNNNIDNCRADITFASNAMKMSKVKKVYFKKGWFNETIPNNEINTISVLHIDSDWYESVKLCLDNFFPKIVNGGIVIIDDYYFWEGCRKAVNEYLYNNTQYFIREWENTKVFYIVK